VSRWDLYWTEQMDPEDRPAGAAPGLGLALAWLGAGGGFLGGLVLALGLVAVPSLPSLTVALLPFLAILLIGCFLL
jgi:hypothetical protein